MRKLKDLVVILLMLLAVSAGFLFIYNKYNVNTTTNSSNDITLEESSSNKRDNISGTASLSFKSAGFYDSSRTSDHGCPGRNVTCCATAVSDAMPTSTFIGAEVKASLDLSDWEYNLDFYNNADCGSQIDMRAIESSDVESIESSIYGLSFVGEYVSYEIDYGGTLSFVADTALFLQVNSGEEVYFAASSERQTFEVDVNSILYIYSYGSDTVSIHDVLLKYYDDNLDEYIENISENFNEFDFYFGYSSNLIDCRSYNPFSLDSMYIATINRRIAWYSSNDSSYNIDFDTYDVDFIFEPDFASETVYFYVGIVASCQLVGRDKDADIYTLKNVVFTYSEGVY
ncbi:MAG: hypothetical protein K6G28_05665 [Acholeplasmatales bacterium]|nr:hypothetical protein [Acholeplasmatales bacterium]